MFKLKIYLFIFTALFSSVVFSIVEPKYRGVYTYGGPTYQDEFGEAIIFDSKTEVCARVLQQLYLCF